MKTLIHNRQELQRIVRFAIVGVVNTGVDVGVFSLLFFVAGAPLLLANSIGYLVSVTGSFVLNRSWTFADTGNHTPLARQYVLFITLGLGGLALSNLVVWALAQVMAEILGKLVSVGVLFVWNFSTSRLIVFRARRPIRPTDANY